uniref:Uncharacterized protein n=1 Tax=Anguilla anguilla TaxID=7936 RepID=A0A0E9WHE1_ANGAN
MVVEHKYLSSFIMYSLNLTQCSFGSLSFVMSLFLSTKRSVSVARCPHFYQSRA